MLKLARIRPEVFCKKDVLENFTGKQASTSNFIKKETLVQVFSCEICEIFKNTFLDRTRPVAASVKNLPVPDTVAELRF